MILFSIVLIVSYAAGAVTMGIFLYLVTMDNLEAHLAIGILFGICSSLRLVSKVLKLNFFSNTETFTT